MSATQIIRPGYPYAPPVVSGLGQLTLQERQKRARALARSGRTGRKGEAYRRRGIEGQRAAARQAAQEAARRPAPLLTPEQAAHRAERRRQSQEGLRRFFMGKRYATGTTTTLPVPRPGVPGVVIKSPRIAAGRGAVRQGRDPSVYAGGTVSKVYQATPRFAQERTAAERHAQFMQRIAPTVQEEAATALPMMPGQPGTVPATIAPATPQPPAVVASGQLRSESALRKLGI